MGNRPRFYHRGRIENLAAKQEYSKLDRYLDRLSRKGFDIAGVPFQLLDRLLEKQSKHQIESALPLARHTLGGQPRLLTAILNDLINSSSCKELRKIVRDSTAHPMTRFEAMGWTVFLRHRSAFPEQGEKLQDLFQFWDKDPPLEIQQAQKLWTSKAQNYVDYDDASAHDFILEKFGQDVADMYSALWHPALKSDVFRLCRLAKCGGLYCDADSRPGSLLSKFLQHAGNKVWASSMSNVPNCVVTNGFIAAPAGARMIEDFLDEVLRNIRDQAESGIFWLSGPGALTTFMYRNGSKYDVGLLSASCLKSDLFRQFDADYKKSEMNWRVFEYKRGLNNNAGLANALSPT
ncbi:glycosyltransferase [Pseudaestuariivita rosea]|uniref:glycosyltransferase n=1 Tax=Pseudaestuariivita rosea TaxID=2763263 RepID=UPI001ABB3F6B|nr:glycosyltransferase [Pseudaestuariivita rosea]